MITSQASKEAERLRVQAQQTRASAIRTRIMAAFGFVSVAETQAEWYSVEEARSTLFKVEKVIAEVERHLAEPYHVPAPLAAELHDLLGQLKRKTELVEASLWSQKPQ